MSQPPRYMRSTTSSAPRDDPIYDGDALASRPFTTQLGHNLDFSGLSVVMEVTYRQCESENPRMSRELPFCVFQHAIVEHLNAYLIHQQKFYNADPRFQAEMDPLEIINAKNVLIPKVIHNYISGIGKTLTTAGDAIMVNLPAAGTPQIACGVPVGSFGPLNAVTHNAYESYWSPFISKALILRTLEMNTVGQNRRNFDDWNPFPAGQFPAGGVLNGNLLGYHRPQRIHNDAINVLNDCQFDEGDTLSGRLCHSPACIEKVSMTLGRLKMVESCLAIYKPEENPAILVSKMYVSNNLPIDARLADKIAGLGSPYAFGKSAANRAAYFGYKRRRTETAPGVCVIVKNVLNADFVATRNDNYLMLGEYAVQNQLRDRASLRAIHHISISSEGAQQLILASWMINLRLTQSRIPQIYRRQLQY